MFTPLERASYVSAYLKTKRYPLVGDTNNSGSQKRVFIIVFFSVKWHFLFVGSHIKINPLELYTK